MTELLVLMDACIFQSLQMPESRHRFYHKAANSDSAYWNGAPALFLLALDWHGIVG